MLFTGVVCGFGGYSEQQLEQMRLDLNLCMPLHKLKACTMYYKNTAKRDPFIEEIRFLDRFLEKATHSPTAVAPRELLTNDPFVAKTYADLVEKRRKISPDAQKPCSLSEAFELMSAYLGRVGKTVSLSHEAFSLEDLSDLPELAESPDLLSTKDAGYGFRRAFRPKQTFENTDLLVILAPSKGLTPAEEAIAFNAFLSNDSFTSHAKTIRAIGELGVLYEILSLAAGAAIDLDALATADKDRELDALVTDHLHHYLLRISNQSCDFLAKSVKSIGLCVLPVATLANPQTVSIGHGQRIDFSWSSDFIRSLFAFTPVSMHLRDEVAVEAAPIQNTLHRVGA